MTTTAQIAAKGCQSTGITEELATSLHNQLGKKVMAVVELEVASRSENADGDEKVGLRIVTVEPAPNTDTEDHLRNLQRSFHYERKLHDSSGQLVIETGDDIEPKVSDVLAQRARFEPHPFLPVDAADDDGICDVCGNREGAAQHQRLVDLDDQDDEDDEDDEDTVQDEDDDESEGEDEPNNVTTIPSPFATTP